LKLSNGSFGKIAYLKTFGGDKIYENLIQLLQDKRTTYTQLMNIANKIAESPQLYTIILDIAAYFNLAELYSKLTKSLNSIKKLNIKNPVAIFNLITEIQKCL
ncbi:MAG: hypothetical protein MJ158_02660, partial [Alphaproteobacteria bacterium]|nr:hypothetical protein [Alphaproteobacteria bacterium]